MRHGLVFLTLAMCLAASCGNADKAYVRKAVRLMDRQGLFAKGPEWDAAKAEALSAAAGRF